jgi:hypothetical protein
MSRITQLTEWDITLYFLVLESPLITSRELVADRNSLITRFTRTLRANLTHIWWSCVQPLQCACVVFLPPSGVIKANCIVSYGYCAVKTENRRGACVVLDLLAVRIRMRFNHNENSIRWPFRWCYSGRLRPLFHVPALAPFDACQSSRRNRISAGSYYYFFHYMHSSACRGDQAIWLILTFGDNPCASEQKTYIDCIAI